MNRAIYKGALPDGWEHLFLDFETYYEGKYGLRHMTTEEYVRDPRFQPLCAVALHNGDQDCTALKADDIAGYLSGIDWDRTVLVAHNSAFDVFILTEHFGHKPARVVDTMSLARVLFPNHAGGYSLQNLAQTMLGDAGKNLEIAAQEGLDVRYFEGNPDAYEWLLRYCAKDTFLCRDLYRHLLKTGRVDKVEMSCIDGMIRSTTDPILVLDPDIVEPYAQEREAQVEANKHLSKDDLFAEALRAQGIEPETKLTNAGNTKFAFAKSDPFMQDLLAQGTPEVQALVEGRLLAKSTSEKSKARRFADIAKRGRLPVFIQPNGTHTGRDSGSGSINLQNVQRGSPLRRAVMAPEGHTLIVADSSQIECRVLNWWAGEEWVKDVFSSGGKIYEVSGEKVLGQPVNKHETPELYQLAKVIELGCGYRTGGMKIAAEIKGNPHIEREFSEEECETLVQGYRESHEHVADLWRRLDRLIPQMAAAPEKWIPVDLGDLTFHYGKDRIRLPSGRHLVYPGIRLDSNAYSWVFDYLKGRRSFERNLHGGPITNNITQAMARDIIWEADARFRKAYEHLGVRLAMRVHDELVYSVPKDIAEDMYRELVIEMNTSPSWLEDIVLETEGSIADRWGDAK